MKTRNDWLLPSLEILFGLCMRFRKLSHVFRGGQNQGHNPPPPDRAICSTGKEDRTG